MTPETVAVLGFVTLFVLMLLIAIRTYRLIFHPEDVHDAKVKTAE